MNHHFHRMLAGFAVALPALAQYGGPAILSRGEAPSALNSPMIHFQPFVEIGAVYSTGLTGVAVDSNGKVDNVPSAGVSVNGGISGSHSWRHTSLGLSYRGGYVRYIPRSQYSTTDQSLLLSIGHQVSRHVYLSLGNSFGIVNSNYGLLSTISQSVSFDPSQSYVPTTNFFDNRTIFVASMANLVYQKSMRLSFSFGGGVFTDRYSSSALYGATGLSSSADVQYRLSKRATAGAAYSYGHYFYSIAGNGSDVHSVSGTYAYQLSRWWEFSGFAGFARLESKFIQNVPVDPAIAAIIGITQSSSVFYNRFYTPSLGARISRSFRKGVLYANAGHGITPGNGLFMTSAATNLGVGYTYTGLRRWSFAASTSYQNARSYGNVDGRYNGLVATSNLSHQIGRNFHAVASFSESRYGSADFSRYNLWVYMARLGVGWTPSDVPLRMW